MRWRESASDICSVDLLTVAFVASLGMRLSHTCYIESHENTDGCARERNDHRGSPIDSRSTESIKLKEIQRRRLRLILNLLGCARGSRPAQKAYAWYRFRVLCRCRSSLRRGRR